MNENIIISDILPIEKSNELRLIKKRKELLDLLYVEKYSSKEDLYNDKKTLLEDIRVLGRLIDPKIPEESWLLPELEKLEQELSEEDALKEKWSTFSNEDFNKILDILESRYRSACEEYDAKKMDEALHLIRAVKKQVDNEIGREVIEGTCSENMILFNRHINDITRKI